MSLVDLGGMTVGFFINGVIFILVIGSLISLTILKLFQQRKQAAFRYLAGAGAMLVIFIFVLQKWFS